ncbi:MAG TPA: hypothetical protein VGE98_06615 [Thermoanaerobaculia bacterium]
MPYGKSGSTQPAAHGRERRGAHAELVATARQKLGRERGRGHLSPRGES